MEPDTKAVIAFLVGMRPVRDELFEIRRRLQRRHEVKNVVICPIEITPAPAFGVSVELRNGGVVDFWLELSFDGASWQLDYSVQRHDPDEDGSHAVRSFPVREIRSVAEVPSVVMEAVEELGRTSLDDDLYV